MNFISFTAQAQTAVAPVSGGRTDWGFVAVVAGLVFAAIQAHRFWRQTIRLEDQLEATRKDLGFTLERYQETFKALHPAAAFAERGSGLVTEATPGWVAAGLPEVGRRLGSADEAIAKTWSGLPAPAADGTVGAPLELMLQGRRFEARPLTGASLGLYLVQAK